MNSLSLRTSREARVLAVLLQAAGVASLALTGACGPDKGEESSGQEPGTGGGTVTETVGMTSMTPEPTMGPVTDAPPTPDTATSDDLPECPVDQFDTVECFDPPGDTTTGDDSTGGDDGSTGGPGSTGTSAGDSTGAGSTDDGTTATGTTGGGLCDGFTPSLPADCGFGPIWVSEVFEQRGQCCVEVTWEETCCGRPFLVEETARTARAVGRADWSSPAAPVVAGLSPAERAALAAGWAEDGLAEHASVAAFARFALQLLALGAPASLVAAAQQAMADELAHARLCFGLAAAYGGAPLGPSALPLAGALAGVDDLTAVTVATLREGCIGETIAALQAEAARERARDPAVRAALAQIAADELRHAELAWRFVAWALERGGPELHAACAAAFAAAEAAVGRTFGHVVEDMSERIGAHGRLGAGGRAAVARRAMTAVIGPAARALLARHAPPAAA